jgi:transcriptional regulator with XRE-family HTH domain
VKEFPKILKELRQEKGLTQAQLGKILGYTSHSIIAQWENGQLMPTVENLIKIAKYFNESVDYLLGLEK